jgi:hypothetical protein
MTIVCKHPIFDIECEDSLCRGCYELWHFHYTPQIASRPLLVPRQHQHEYKYKAKLRTSIITNGKINRYDNAVRCGAASITVLSVVTLRS